MTAALLALALAGPLHPAEEVVPRAIAAEDAPVTLRFGWRPGLVLAVEVELVRVHREAGRERTARRRLAYALEAVAAGDGLEVRAGAPRELEASPPGVADDALPPFAPFGRPPVRLSRAGAFAGVGGAPAEAVEAELRRQHAMLLGRWLGRAWRTGEPVEPEAASAAPAPGEAPRSGATSELAGHVPCAPGGPARCVRLVQIARGEGGEVSAALVTDPDTAVPVLLEERTERARAVAVDGKPGRVETTDRIRMTFRPRR